MDSFKYYYIEKKDSENGKIYLYSMVEIKRYVHNNNFNFFEKYLPSNNPIKC
jgi:hypothetical protein